MTEHKKANLCRQWLQYCLSIGWSRDDLKGLANVFWKHEGWRTFKGYKPQE